MRRSKNIGLTPLFGLFGGGGGDLAVEARRRHTGTLQGADDYQMRFVFFCVIISIYGLWGIDQVFSVISTN